jgi:hypothetical protein
VCPLRHVCPAAVTTRTGLEIAIAKMPSSPSFKVAVSAASSSVGRAPVAPQNQTTNSVRRQHPGSVSVLQNNQRTAAVSGSRDLKQVIFHSATVHCGPMTRYLSQAKRGDAVYVRTGRPITARAGRFEKMPVTWREPWPHVAVLIRSNPAIFYVTTNLS